MHDFDNDYPEESGELDNLNVLFHRLDKAVAKLDEKIKWVILLSSIALGIRGWDAVVPTVVKAMGF